MEERTTTQPYCENHNAFLADRYVEGTCPRCGYEDARGDQCDSCGNLLDPFELIKPRCKICKDQSPVPRQTKHIFLLLDKLQPKIEEWFSKASEDGKWSPNSIAITKSWLAKGLEGRSITRDLKSVAVAVWLVVGGDLTRYCLLGGVYQSLFRDTRTKSSTSGEEAPMLLATASLVRTR